MRAAVEQLHLVSHGGAHGRGRLAATTNWPWASKSMPAECGFRAAAREWKRERCWPIAAAPLLAEPIAQPQPVAALIQALVPAGVVQVPATPQADWLARWLPLPEADRTGSPPPALPQPVFASAARCSDKNCARHFCGSRFAEKLPFTPACRFCDSPRSILSFPGVLAAPDHLFRLFLIKRFWP